jgi:hypothetical protein
MQDFAPFIPELLGALSGPQTPEQARHVCPHQFACYFSIFSCYFKIAGHVDLDMLHMFSVKLNVYLL